MYNATLITIAVIAILILTLWYIWNVIFFKSWRKLFFMFLGVFLESTKRVDENRVIEPSKHIPKSDAMKAQAESLDFDVVVSKSRPPAPPKATIPVNETGEFAHDTSYNGWPRELDEKTRHDSRPFRAVHLNTENDDIQTLMDNNEFQGEAPIENDGNPET
jgi:hypothetical protein